ncbi:MAG TPA: HAD-IA family hydrolase [Steroidobacteraceae bacterium]|jgi:HAD superfamily hydrolase (TIGR01509 family)
MGATHSLKAVLWDVDGTLAETERDGHLVAFNQAFAELGLPWRWSQARYGELLQISGGRERLAHDLESQPAATGDAVERAALVERIHRLKNELYARIVVTGALPLRGGVAELLQECRQAGLQIGIATTTSQANVAALLGAQLGPEWRAGFDAVVCAEQAPRKKPDPQVYQCALRTLNRAGHEVLAIEDAPAGVSAARAAGIAVLVVRSLYFPDGAVDDVIAVGPSLARTEGWRPQVNAPSRSRIQLRQLLEWRRMWQAERAGH